jgi:hypothetical protein
VKGGSGTSVVSALLALAISGKASTTLVDVEGDQSDIFGVSVPETGFRDWWRSGRDASALGQLGVALSPALQLVGPGNPAVPFTDRQIDVSSDRPVIFDAGTVRDDCVAAHVVEASSKSLLILRPCYLAARRASSTSLRVDGLIVVEERGRALQAHDLGDVVGAPVVATVPWDVSIARTIDAGRLGNRVPKGARSLEVLAASLVSELHHAA